MSSVWICIPSVRPGGGTLPAWKAAGYKIAIVRQGPSVPEADIEIPTTSYLGWGRSINMAVRAAMEADQWADWFVAGGDDTLPDPNHSPDEIARECDTHFSILHEVPAPHPRSQYGVMQPIGDLKLWPNSRIDNFAGSPWMGREWCKRAYGGKGPLDEEYFHMFGDQNLQEVATKLGVFWQRPDLIHEHRHWARKPGGRYTMDDCPDFGKPLNSPEHWKASKALFESRRAAGWPGSEPLAC